MSIRVLLCDDHDMVRDALGRVLQEESDIEIVASARSVDACLKHLAQNEGKIDVAVLDVRLTDGVGHDITRWIKANHPLIIAMLLLPLLMSILIAEFLNMKNDLSALRHRKDEECPERESNPQEVAFRGV